MADYAIISSLITTPKIIAPVFNQPQAPPLTLQSHIGYLIAVVVALLPPPGAIVAQGYRLSVLLPNRHHFGNMGPAMQLPVTFSFVPHIATTIAARGTKTAISTQYSYPYICLVLSIQFADLPTTT